MKNGDSIIMLFKNKYFRVYLKSVTLRTLVLVFAYRFGLIWLDLVAILYLEFEKKFERKFSEIEIPTMKFSKLKI